MPIMREQISKLIGSAGATIRDLEAKTGAKIVLHEPSGGGSAMVHFYGPSQAIYESGERALADILGTSIQVRWIKLL